MAKKSGSHHAENPHIYIYIYRWKTLSVEQRPDYFPLGPLYLDYQDVPWITVFDPEEPRKPARESALVVPSIAGWGGAR